MNLLKHDIVTEFPQHKDKIHTLKTSNAHFAKLFESYDTLNHAIAKIEMGGGAAITDEALEIEKKKRLKLKDEIVHMLQQP
nr:DUF465 domain-containing protein [Rhodoferax sp.]